MTFEEKYLNGLCAFSDVDVYVQQWHEQEDISATLPAFLGLTDQEYAAYGEIYQVREGFEDAYIYVVICHRDEEGCMEFGCPMEGKRPIFYERVKKDEVINVMVDGEQKPFYLEMKWVDDDHIFIHDRVVDISEGYDYRNDTDS